MALLEGPWSLRAVGGRVNYGNVGNDDAFELWDETSFAALYGVTDPAVYPLYFSGAVTGSATQAFLTDEGASLSPVVGGSSKGS